MPEDMDSGDSQHEPQEGSPDASQSPGEQDAPQPSPAVPPDSSIPSFVAKLGDESMLDFTQRKPPQPTPDATLTLAPLDSLLGLKVGDRVHGYRIEENPDKDANTTYIGEGTSGVIYRAQHVGLGRWVALKFLKQGGASPEELEQFRTEAATIAKLPGRNILQVYDFSEWNENMFMAMELLDGGSAKNRMEKQFGVPPTSGIWKNITKILKKEQPAERPIEYIVSKADIEYFVGTTIQVAEQLEVAHDNGILHRDIKPGNIMLRDEKHAVLVDYGLAALIKDETTIAAGTPGFMAPEQISAEPSDARTDVFGLGATLYNMLTNKYVHKIKGGENFAELAGIIINGSTTNIRLLNKNMDTNLAAIVHKAVLKDPRRRYETAREFYEDLKRWMDGKYVKARPITSLFVPTVRRLKKQGLKWLTTAALAGALGGLATSLYKAKEPVRLRDARVENYIADIKSSASAADAMRETANKSYDELKQKRLIELFQGNVDLATLINYQKTIVDVFDNYSKALKLAEEWKKDDVSPEKKSQEKIREFDPLVKDFEGKKEYAMQKVSAYEKVVEAMESYKEKEFAKAEEALALALDRLYEGDTQKELERMKKEHNLYKEQRTWQGVRDVAARVRAYRRVCRACFMDEIEVFSGSEKEITPETGIEWKKMITSIEKILETPDDAILRKIPLDPKTHRDLIAYARADAKEAFDSEQSILKNKDVKDRVDMKRNSDAEKKYVAEVTEKYKSGEMDDEEYIGRIRLPPPFHEKFEEALDSAVKKGIISGKLYKKLVLEK